MFVPRSVRSVLLAFAAGCAPLTLALALPGQPAPHTSPSKTGTDSPHAVAEALDAIVQPRFLDDRAGVFGTGRVISPVRGHVGTTYFQPKTPGETQLWEAANQAKLPYVLGFLHCAHVPGRFTDKEPATDPFRPVNASFSRLFTMYPDVGTPAFQAAWKQCNSQEKAQDKFFQTAALKALPALMKGKGQETTQGNWLVMMRPVLAAKESCLSCHVGAKKNDTLGVMVYAVDKNAVKAPIRVTSEGLQ